MMSIISNSILKLNYYVLILVLNYFTGDLPRLINNDPERAEDHHLSDKQWWIHH